MKNKNFFTKALSLIKDKKQLYLLFFFSIVGVFVELLSIAIVVPVVVFLIEQNPLEKFQILEPIFNFLSISTKDEMITFCLIGIVIVYLFRFLFLVFLHYYKNLFSYNLNLNIKKDLIDQYLSQKYSYFFNQNSSRLIKNIIVEISHFSGGAVDRLFYIFIDIFVIVTVFASLIFFEPTISLIIAFFLILVGLILNTLSKGRFTRWGKLRFDLDQDFMKFMLEMFNSIREIKVYGKKIFYVKNFIQKYSPLGYLSVKQQTFNAIIKQTKQSQQKDLKTYVNNSNKSPLELLGNHLKGLEAIS